MKAKKRTPPNNLDDKNDRPLTDARPESTSSSSLEISESLLRSSSESASAAAPSSSSGGSVPRHLVRPPISYAMLITEAIQSSPEKQLILCEIYDYVQEHYPYFRDAGSGWKNSIRHNLSLNKAFCKVPRPSRAPGKGSYWKLAEAPMGLSRSHADKSIPRRRHSFAGPMDHMMFPMTAGLEAHRPRAASESGAGRLPPIRPRPRIDPGQMFPLLDKGHPADPNSFFPPTAMMLDMATPSGVTPNAMIGNATIDMSRPLFDSSVESLGSSNISFSLNQPYTFYHDVFLGAGSPKQPDSPAEILPAAIGPIDNSGRTPPSEVFESNPPPMPFNGLI